MKSEFQSPRLKIILTVVLLEKKGPFLVKGIFWNVAIISFAFKKLFWKEIELL